MLANDGRFASDPGAVINEKTAADPGAGMNLDTRDGVGDLRNHTRDEWRPQTMQFMGEPVMRNGGNARIADKHLVDTPRGRISS